MLSQNFRNYKTYTFHQCINISNFNILVFKRQIFVISAGENRTEKSIFQLLGNSKSINDFIF